MDIWISIIGHSYQLSDAAVSIIEESLNFVAQLLVDLMDPLDIFAECKGRYAK